MRPPFEDQNRPVRGALRVLGFVLVGAGGLLALVGLIDFFSAFGGHGMPTKFWCLFVGMPMVGFGSMCLKAGYLGSIGRYVAGESTPVVGESAKYLAEELRPTVRRYAEDLRGASTPESASAKTDPAARLKRLEELRDAGLITAAEFDAKRVEIIKEL